MPLVRELDGLRRWVSGLSGDFGSGSAAWQTEYGHPVGMLVCRVADRRPSGPRSASERAPACHHATPGDESAETREER